jgi:hypothetical protein
MAGNTDVLIGHWNNMFVHVPICTAIAEKKRMEVSGDLWTSVLLAALAVRGEGRASGGMKINNSDK